MSSFNDLLQKLKPSFSGKPLFTMPTSHEEKKKLVIFALSALFFISASIFSMWNYIALNKSSVGLEDIGMSNAPDGPGEEVRGKTEEINTKMESYIKYSRDSQQLLALAGAVGKSPLDPLQTISAAEMDVPDMPPSISIKALVIMENGRAVTLDIDGEVPGQIMKVGSVFGNGRGKVTGIDSKGVNWTWLMKNYRTEF